jgi:hypothetical protein
MEKCPNGATVAAPVAACFSRKGAGAHAPFGVGHLYTLYHIINHYHVYRKARNSYLSHACVLKICFPPSKCSLQEAMPMSCLQLGHNFKQTAVSAKRLPCCLLADSPERAREQRLQSLCRPGIDHMFALYLSIESRRLPKSARAIRAGIGIQRMNSAICGLSWPVGLSLYVMSNPSPLSKLKDQLAMCGK